LSLTDQEDLTFTLTGGRPDEPVGAGPPVFIFPFPGGAWPEIGRRGEFHLKAEGWRPARFIDRRGARVYLSLAAEKPLPSPLSGQIRFFPRPPAPELKLSPDRPAPPGAALFLDPQEGWLWNATEAAGQKDSLYEPELWPTIAPGDIPARLGTAGLSFIWQQTPDPEGVTARLLAEHFLRTHGRLLVVGDCPADLEPLADQSGAIFIGEARAGSPLSRASLGSEIDRRRAARETRLAEIHRSMADLRSAEAAQRARLDLWTDLGDLERRFQDLGRDLGHRSREWGRIRAKAAEQQTAWEEVSRKSEGFWGRLGRFLAKLWSRLGRFLVKAEEERRRDLDAAEAAVREVRLAEKAALSEARNLEERLSRLRREAGSWPPRAELAAELERLAGEQKAAAADLAGESARPLPEPDRLLAEAPLCLALAPDLPHAGRLFPAVLRLASLRPDPPARQSLAGLALHAEKHLVIMGDFTFWPVWSGRAPSLPEAPESPAWRNFKLAGAESGLAEFLAEGGLFRSAAPPQVSAPRLARLELDPEARSAAVGLGLRALGEMGPVNPVSALTVARAALHFARNRPEEPAVLILTASPAQGRLVDLMLQDLMAPPGLVFAGEPQAFNGWPRAPLVILEPAFETPHHGHPWTWPTFGRWRLQLAWSLAGEHIWLAGRDAWLRRLPTAAPLAVLWRAAEPEQAPIPPPETPPDSVRKILDTAKTEIWAFLPTPGAAWWKDWEEPLLAAARRRLPVTVLSAPPGPEDDTDFAGAALRILGTNNCTVGLASGFPGFLAGVDDRHLIWGAEGAEFNCLPLAARHLAEILQLKLIVEKIGRRGGGLKNCRRCGRPLMLINQSQMRGLGDEQPLQVGCLGCPDPGRQRLDERRDPFTAPPKCGLDLFTPYQRFPHGRHQEVWACPLHPGGPTCPSYRVIPGDCP
jgi:hypothetical protein